MGSDRRHHRKIIAERQIERIDGVRVMRNKTAFSVGKLPESVLHKDSM